MHGLGYIHPHLPPHPSPTDVPHLSVLRASNQSVHRQGNDECQNCPVHNHLRGLHRVEARMARTSTVLGPVPEPMQHNKFPFQPCTPTGHNVASCPAMQEQSRVCVGPLSLAFWLGLGGLVVGMFTKLLGGAYAFPKDPIWCRRHQSAGCWHGAKGKGPPFPSAAYI